MSPERINAEGIPCVSIAILAWNEEAAIAATLRSLFHQSLFAQLSKRTLSCAPYDKLSRASLEEVARRFRVISTGWYELRRLPVGWWPRYALKKARHTPHWRIGSTLLLSHPGCLLSYHRSYCAML